MRPKITFTQQKIDQIRELFKKKSKAFGVDQKTIRGRIRHIGFNIRDFDRTGRGFGLPDFDQLVRNGVIQIKDE